MTRYLNFVGSQLRFEILILLFIIIKYSGSSDVENKFSLVKSDPLRLANNGTDSILRDSQINSRLRSISTEVHNGSDKRQNENLSTDCIAKRDEILHRHRRNDHRSKNGPPRQESNSPVGPFNDSLNVGTNLIEGEHLPHCTQLGRYEPIQCHKAIGYCWCVNKYGQAIKNSAVVSNQQPICDMTTYESDNVESLVVTGVSTKRINGLGLKESSEEHPDGATSELHHSNSESDLESRNRNNGADSQGSESQDAYARSVSASEVPELSLVENECTLSRTKAKERASKHTDTSIWIPECDVENKKLYAEQQCTTTSQQHRVCWCVDQSTGLPLRTNEQLSVRANINCTDVKRMAQTTVKTNRQKKPSSFYHGFDEFCDAYKRSEFVGSLIVQFREQLSDFIARNPSSSLSGSTRDSSDPYMLDESVVSTWMFRLLDMNHNGVLDDREWSWFKKNFKTVESDTHRSQKQHLKNNLHQPAIPPLYILRDQRRCWREFLNFCGNGDILIHEFNLSKWLSCTELPSKRRPITHLIDKVRGQDANQNSSSVTAYTLEAAIIRSKTKNPFSSILHPD